MANENEAVSKTGALADVATDEDTLFHEGYVNGIAQFIRECATPMTIAIQGDWGSGKTSLMKLIEAKLRDETEPPEGSKPKKPQYNKDIIAVATVDCWQQYSANPNAELFDAILAEMLAKLTGMSVTTVKGVSDFANAITQAVNGLLTDQIADPQDKSLVGSVLTWFLGSDSNKQSAAPETEVYSAEDVQELQAAFVDLLKHVAEKNGKTADSRLVVFVDGLDHISSEAAVTLMDQIKTYLDCPRCVFVLSVDKKTVSDGVAAKLGDRVDEGRKKLYFDRLVQVPFRIPSSAYNLDSYVKDLLGDNRELADEFAAVIDILMKEPTMRRIKRCLNTMYLHLSVLGGSQNVPSDTQAMLLAAVILQVEGPQGFDTIAKIADGSEEQFSEDLDAVLESPNLGDRINWAMLPIMWQDKDTGEINAARRKTFMSWVRQLR